MPNPSWKAPQWCAYLADKEIPVMQHTVDSVNVYLRENSEDLTARRISNIACDDPFFALRLLRKAEIKRSHGRLSTESTTLLTCVLHLGIDFIVSDLMSAHICPAVDGLAHCQHRAALGAKIARNWAIHRIDILPDEITMAALLSDIGELMLWLWAPTLPEAAINLRLSGQIKRNRDAQLQVAGFGFKDLSILLTEVWNLPLPIKQLINTSDNNRSKLARCAVEAARHLCADDGLIAIPDDIRAIRSLCPSAKITELLKPLNLSEDNYSFVITQLSEGT